MRLGMVLEEVPQQDAGGLLVHVLDMRLPGQLRDLAVILQAAAARC